MWQAAGMEPENRVRILLVAASTYSTEASGAYDEVVEQVAARVAEAGCLGKLDLGALTAWKRLRADTRWIRELMSCADSEVRRYTARAVIAARDESMVVPLAAAAARWALAPLPGFANGDAIGCVLRGSATAHGGPRPPRTRGPATTGSGT
jgi:hypothetical protein